jgi:NAD(P)-dependent dehydrogenase (short-subunit alcohol dehydrogenase family)
MPRHGEGEVVMDDVLGYAGRTVVVTGAASGMGAACAEILVGLDADVIGVDIRPTTAAGARSVELDQKDPRSIEEVAASIEAPVLAVFACAGLPGPPFSDLDVLLVNYVGGRPLIEQLIPKMEAGSAIGYIASNAGLGWQQNLEQLLPFVTTDGFAGGRAWLEANPGAYAGNGYAFSKQVINAWVAWTGATLIRHGIRINNINPGPTATPMMPFFHDASGKELVEAFLGPIARYSTPEEQAWPLVCLNSPRLSYVNGEALHVDGGFLGAMVTGQLDIASLLPS